MPKKTFAPEQIVGKLRQIELLVDKTVPQACKEAGITDQTFYREEYGASRWNRPGR